ncbi:deoxynucleotidyltransferase terminal-interacting protein 2-like [Uloborus diversus]|uniref:deoxynucleotidyltransferase terminal-interacting protein 2-like n=1 Tax=Uloborus diversus TaxID=327109 RepID=UPI002409535E|nr:deoxynucleotidyltransferase terminal-interacting protein 2-like [Uloborus diversus]
MTEKKVIEFETFLNEVLKEDLKKVQIHRGSLCQEILELEQLKVVIERLQEAELNKEEIKTRVDLGCNFYVQANVTDTKYIFVKTGLADISSDDDSDVEIPSFFVPAFKKYGNLKSYKEETPTCDIAIQKKHIKLASSLDAGDDYEKSTYVMLNPDMESIQGKVKHEKEVLKKNIGENVKKSIVFQNGFETMEKVPIFKSRRQLKKEGLKEKGKTKGSQWYNMAAPEMTEEKKNDLLVLQMRQALDPKHFYKRSANKTNPKYFEVGTFEESPVDFFSSRVPKKQRKQTLVDELLADAEFRSYQKKKMLEAQKMQPQKFRRMKKPKKTKLKEAKFADSHKKSKKSRK